MHSWRRLAAVAGGLLLLTALVGLSGLARATWLRLAEAVLPWQRSQIGLQERHEELLDLRERNARLNAERVELAGRLRDYEAIRGEGGIDPLRAVVAIARVIARSPRAGRSLVEIDVGVLDGVRRGMICLAGWSLVGTVIGEERHRSAVQLITDPESRIPAALYSLQGDFVGEGLLVGDPASAGCRLLYIDDHPDLVIEPGMEVLTSGTDGRLPRDLVLGQVAEVEQPPGDDHWSIIVRPLRRVDHLGGFQIADVARIADTPAGD
jgi:rod shape-determining protein MreC